MVFRPRRIFRLASTSSINTQLNITEKNCFLNLAGKFVGIFWFVMLVTCHNLRGPAAFANGLLGQFLNFKGNYAEFV